MNVVNYYYENRYPIDNEFYEGLLCGIQKVFNQGCREALIKCVEANFKDSQRVVGEAENLVAKLPKLDTLPVSFDQWKDVQSVKSQLEERCASAAKKVKRMHLLQCMWNPNDSSRKIFHELLELINFHKKVDECHRKCLAIIRTDKDLKERRREQAGHQECCFLS